MSPCDGLLVPFFQLCEAFSRNPPCVPLAGTENPKNKATAYVRFLRADMYPEGLKPAHESVRRSGKHLLPVLSKVLTAIVVPTISYYLLNCQPKLQLQPQYDMCLWLERGVSHMCGQPLSPLSGKQVLQVFLTTTVQKRSMVLGPLLAPVTNFPVQYPHIPVSKCGISFLPSFHVQHQMRKGVTKCRDFVVQNSCPEKHDSRLQTVLNWISSGWK